MKINSTVDKFVGIIIMVALFVAFIPTLLTSFGNLSGLTDLPLMNLFSTGGVVPLILGVYVFYVIIKGLQQGKSRK